MGRRWRLAVLAGLFALVTACGGGGDDGADGVASASDGNEPAAAEDEPKGSDEDQMLAFAKCMREHGVDVPDPEPGGKGGIEIRAERADGSRTEQDKAMAACKELLPNGGEPPKPSAKDLDEMRTQAKCLREHGLDVPDPTMDKPFIELGGDAGDPDKVNKAMEECGDGHGSVTVHQGESPGGNTDGAPEKSGGGK
jgi:hypothetical protein